MDSDKIERIERLIDEMLLRAMQEGAFRESITYGTIEQLKYQDKKILVAEELKEIARVAILKELLDE